jgi:hypothetical protein
MKQLSLIAVLVLAGTVACSDKNDAGSRPPPVPPPNPAATDNWVINPPNQLPR